MSWVSEALRDENGLGDIAYGGVAVVTVAVLGTIFFLAGMEALEYRRCVEDLKAAPPVLCRFDSESFGTAVGFVCGGYAAALTALAAYMAATRRGAVTKTVTTSTTVEPPPIPPAAVMSMASRGMVAPGVVQPGLGTEDSPVHVEVKDEERYSRKSLKGKKGGR